EVTIQPGQKMILNLGQNIAGVLETTMEAEKDTTVVFSHVEMLNDGNKNPNMASGGSTGPKGTIYTANLRGEKTSVYTFGDDSEVTYRPSFTYFGFQYVQITATKPVTIKKVVGKPITSAMTQTGHIETDNAGINKLFNNVLWSQMDNFLSIPTDCRRETSAAAEATCEGTGTFNFDSVAFLQNYVKICDNQAANFGDGRCHAGTAGLRHECQQRLNDVESSFLTLYQQTGDISIIASSYDQMDKCMDYRRLRRRLQLSFVRRLGFLRPAPFSTNLATAPMTRSSWPKWQALGYADKVENTTQCSGHQNCFANKYVDEQGNILSATADNMLGQSGTTTTSMSTTPRLRSHGHSSSASIATKNTNSTSSQTSRKHQKRRFLRRFRASLSASSARVSFPLGTGATDTAYSLLQQRDFPSWLYSVDQGATTIWSAGTLTPKKTASSRP
ncbi:MAG: family 78 glycoside hydrolase catalytic domain, partial [Merdibacter sp.]